MTAYTPPTLDDVLRARTVIDRRLARTPLHRYPLLDERLGLELHVKHENHQPVGAFKIRGGIYLMSQLSDEERRRGVITASTGNHGQSIAYAARLFGVRAIIVVPEGANPGKVESMRALGSEVRFHGRDFDDARLHVEELCEREGLRYVHSANEPHLIAGVATYALEMLEDEPELDVILVPIGGGSGASGCCTVARALRPELKVIGVQAEAAPAAYLSWKEGRIVEAKMETLAEGIATRTAFELPLSILRQHLDDFLLVSEREIEEAILLYLETTRNLVEGAGAAPLAAARRFRERFRGLKVGLVLSGGNLAVERLATVLARRGEPIAPSAPDPVGPGDRDRS